MRIIIEFRKIERDLLKNFTAGFGKVKFDNIPEKSPNGGHIYKKTAKI